MNWRRRRSGLLVPEAPRMCSIGGLMACMPGAFAPAGNVSASILFATGGGYSLSNGNRTAAGGAGIINNFTQLIGNSGKWMVRITLDSNAHIASDAYIGVFSGSPTYGSPYYQMTLANTKFQSTFSGNVTASISPSDVLDWFYDATTGTVTLKRNGSAVSGSISVGASISLYLNVANGNSDSGAIQWTIASSIPSADVPSGYSVR